MAFAMAGVPTLLPDETFAVNAALRLNRNMQFNGGIGYGPDQRVAGGRVGLRVGW